MWGVFETPEEVHVMPCDEKGCSADHVADSLCFCEPEVEEAEERVLYVHREFN